MPQRLDPVVLAQFAQRMELDDEQTRDFVHEARAFGGFNLAVFGVAQAWQVGPGPVYRVARELGVSPEHLQVHLPWLRESASPNPERVAAHAVGAWMRRFGFEPADLALFGALTRVGPGELASLREFLDQRGMSPAELRTDHHRAHQLIAGEWRPSLPEVEDEVGRAFELEHGRSVVRHEFFQEAMGAMSR